MFQTLAKNADFDIKCQNKSKDILVPGCDIFAFHAPGMVCWTLWTYLVLSVGFVDKTTYKKEQGTYIFVIKNGHTGNQFQLSLEGSGCSVISASKWKTMV